MKKLFNLKFRQIFLAAALPLILISGGFLSITTLNNHQEINDSQSNPSNQTSSKEIACENDPVAKPTSNSTVVSVVDPTITSVWNKTATNETIINFTLTISDYGNDENGNPWHLSTPPNVTLSDGNDNLISPAFYSFVQTSEDTFDLFIQTSETATNLTPGQSYSNWYLIVEFSSDSMLRATDNVKVNLETFVAPIAILPTITEIQIGAINKTDVTLMTKLYFGTTYSNENYLLTGYHIVDITGTNLLVPDDQLIINSDQSVTVTNLNANQTYDNWYLIADFTLASNPIETVSSTPFSVPSFTTESLPNPDDLSVKIGWVFASVLVFLVITIGLAIIFWIY